VIALLSVVSLVVLAGHLVAVARDRTFWPFSHYPMYSYAVRDMSYPILAGRQLTANTLVAVFPDGEEDLLAGALIYPPLLHPLDRVEIAALLVHAGLPGVERAAKNVGDGREPAPGKLDDLLARLAAMVASRSGRKLVALRLVRLTWSDFRSDAAEPTRVLVAEVRP
jgi:hypothetical protein